MVSLLPKLSQKEIEERLKVLSGWSYDGTFIKKKYEFEDFKRAIEFITRIAQEADALDHHPDIYNSYNTVEIKITTHDEMGVTQKDFVLADKIESIAKSMGA
ncbi:4a-hydroxytetrahydrobiopterin dehydratase [Candidatus Marsarchaeota G2 archaeon ECH_B_SAG-G16]|jgi:4a-hydroxytetrahydrobiopterin dehydratase|uniref:Putative pterin-4-alpha-carbinolamine dehydratase n=5 Tax=Candidatus Marsarchaeota TaxID=1978152 RepID=A0A2R6C3V4_9ARCH|nr:MAG: 4a-hydroxytetrahydrobiopterin dehydratase [Candidatus Marsarchaeota G1 archaeon OSP_D]PSN86037.1 MAG: 4a-hydroxytetrahydrobiopterin dehydratase [Candidatus Marsarchaeota G1 archaeon BE_D]PSN87658.1 MAG: 4a-hydroxytetrahydrobiopterin dehydratase [Candidatus Marsarchaeota G1 archaeon OSP_C]PSO04012.1 MAG: 4a-hydroxytetrahydrobiopterin dehydratase [Candidatus Marsarchaeota G2 archaeon ECH_B_SAG-G16]PSO05571.1 MAG: 4a-hydroxytetrahydrobiopterin dehydratase [Candidatus Marsarchaeota G2 archa